MFKKIKKAITKKRIIWAAIILVVLVGGYFMFFNKKVEAQTLTVHTADFLQQVSASGKIEPKDNLDLSFTEVGQVSSVLVKVGDTVLRGQLLASQNTGELSAQYVQMQAGVDLQKAKLAQLVAGASLQDIKTSENAVAIARQNLDSGYINAVASLDSAYTSMNNSLTTISYIQTTYFYTIDAESFVVRDNKNSMSSSILDAKNYIDRAKAAMAKPDIDIAIAHVSSDLQAVYGSLEIIRTQTNLDTYDSQVSLTDKISLDTQKTSIAAAITTVSSAKATIASYQTALAQAQSQLDLKKAPSRDSDIAVYQAQVKQAEGSLQGVAAQLSKKRIYSPISGLVTAVNAKVGRIFSSNDVAVSVISKNNFQVESFIPEINISLIEVGQDADVVLDAYGSGTVFAAKVAQIDPAETLKDGVSTYKVTLEFANNDDSRIKSGMTGNIIITTLQKANTLSVPQGIVVTRNGEKFVSVKNGETSKEVKVQTGSLASNGNIEITSGLADGDVVVLKAAK